jgi:glycosyltransferase involved in cell wall biosynthesis
MKIAQVAPLYETVPPRAYGGTERIVAYLTDALVDLGHEVTLFACADAGTQAELVPCRSRPLWWDDGLRSELAAHLNLLAEVKARADQFDIIHFHTDLLHLPLFADCCERTVTTVHGRLDLGDLARCYAQYPGFPLVSIARHQRAPLPRASWAGTVHHGLPLDLYPFTRAPRSDYLAFLGRVSPEKGLLEAIEIAKGAGMRLKVAAKINDHDRAYFHTVIEPRLDHPLVEFVGEIDDAAKRRFLGNARALLFPIAWPEPFGLVMIEAMACGTPVIAFPQGAVPEVVQHGVTGLIVDSVEAAIAAVRQAEQLDRWRIRRAFECRFSAAVMAQGYVAIYQDLLDEAAPLALVWPGRDRAALTSTN